MSVQNIHVIANPASGSSEPELDVLAEVFRDHGVQWQVSHTREAGDGQRLAQAALDSGADVIAAYGGDGTVGEVAGALVGADTPLAILPGGTANVIAIELGIPRDAAQAARLICGEGSRVDRIDVGEVNDHRFLLRVGIGFEANMIQQADREEKNRLGIAAYLWSGLKNLRKTDIAEYRFRIDDEEVECRGFTCAIANSGNLGLPGLRLGSAISVRDGLLDVVVIEELNFQSLRELFDKVFGDQQVTGDDSEALRGYSEEIDGMLRHWQGRSVSVEVEPAQVVQYDGEILDPAPTTVHCSVLAQQLPVIVPAE